MDAPSRICQTMASGINNAWLIVLAEYNHAIQNMFRSMEHEVLAAKHLHLHNPNIKLTKLKALSIPRHTKNKYLDIYLQKTLAL